MNFCPLQAAFSRELLGSGGEMQESDYNIALYSHLANFITRVAAESAQCLLVGVRESSGVRAEGKIILSFRRT